MSTSGRYDILALPREDENLFLTHGVDLRLFQICGMAENGSMPRGTHHMPLSREKYATLVSVIPEKASTSKCVAWNPSPRHKNLIAIGQQTGKVSLASLKMPDEEESLLNGCEFIPKQSRACLCLEWSPECPNLLAEGLDKWRNDCSLLIWDCASSQAGQGRWLQKSPLAEFGSSSESVLSLAWLGAKRLVAGFNKKELRMLDLREENTSRSHTVSFTKSVHGVCVDPYNEHRIASFNENTVSFFDTRFFEKPILTLDRPGPFIKLAWCPNRSGLLGALRKDSSVVRLFDIQQPEPDLTALEDDVTLPLLEHTIESKRKHFHSFAWLNAQPCSMLTIGPEGEVSEVTICQRIPLDLSPLGEVSYGTESGLFHRTAEAIKIPDIADDISMKMKRRASEGYGLDIARNISIVKDDKDLLRLWMWLQMVCRLKNERKLKQPSTHDSNPFPGVQTMLESEKQKAGDDASRLFHSLGADIPRRYKYISEARKSSMLLCGWDFDEADDNSLDEFLKRLELNNEFERAATIALFNGHVKKAVTILLSGASEARRVDQQRAGQLNLISMALAGYSDNQSLWHEICRQRKNEADDPYLVAAFAFLTSEPNDFESVLTPKDFKSRLQLNDCLASACMFLDSDKLHHYIHDLGITYTDSGLLDGILLTGLSEMGVNLLQKYVERTGDVQTASLVACFAGSKGFPMDERRFEAWIDAYSELLDVWQLWNERAMLNVQRRSNDSRPPSQVFVTCNYCGKSVSGEISGGGGRGGSGGTPGSNRSSRNSFPRHAGMGGGSTKSRTESCPGCRKPLPRCSVCLLHLGTVSSAVKYCTSDVGLSEKEKRIAPFDHWFTWCQTCRHGGHANHMERWFREHTECPVTKCSCKCANLDGFVDRSAAAAARSVSSY